MRRDGMIGPCDSDSYDALARTQGIASGPAERFRVDSAMRRAGIIV
jgi:hypothetical protein